MTTHITTQCDASEIEKKRGRRRTPVRPHYYWIRRMTLWSMVDPFAAIHREWIHRLLRYFNMIFYIYLFSVKRWTVTAESEFRIS